MNDDPRGDRPPAQQQGSSRPQMTPMNLTTMSNPFASSVEPPAHKASMRGEGHREEPAESRVTPGLILSVLPRQRIAEITDTMKMNTSALESVRNAEALCVRMLGMLNDIELRNVAKAAGVSHEGSFIHLYQRLSLLC
jgi:hypothetical protein